MRSALLISATLVSQCSRPEALARNSCAEISCPENELCLSGRCHELCDSNRDCDVAAICDTGVCRPSTCGNGILETGEECDPGLAAWCPITCQLPVCGDGFVAEDEACDDGNSEDNDSCLRGCIRALCGDGVVWARVEECDDGAANRDDGAGACRTNCRLPFCGDGIRDAGEECDQGDATCTPTCRFARCGDGILQPGEHCDDGNQINTDDCPNTCIPARCGDGFVRGLVEECDLGIACRFDCTAARCGDGIVDQGEVCDDGNDNAQDACLRNCRQASCGDGVVWLGVEECDGSVDCRPDCKRAPK